MRLLFLAVATVVFGPAACTQAKASPITGMSAVATEIRTKTGLDVAAPMVFPTLDRGAVLYPSIMVARPGEYAIDLGLAPNCNGATACSYGSLAGRKTPDDTLTSVPAVIGSRPVVLASGIQGRFVPSVCGASCSEGQVFWIKNGVQYTIGLKAGSEADVVRMANSALEGK